MNSFSLRQHGGGEQYGTDVLLRRERGRTAAGLSEPRIPTSRTEAIITSSSQGLKVRVSRTFVSQIPTQGTQCLVDIII